MASSSIQRTIELENKAKLLAGSEKGMLWLLFCSEGAWNKSDLEDFSDFCRNNISRGDDPLQNVTKEYMSDEGITFSHSINGFCYLDTLFSNIHDFVSFTILKLCEPSFEFSALHSSGFRRDRLIELIIDINSDDSLRV